MRFYFGFQKFFIIDRLGINLFFDISTDFIDDDHRSTHPPTHAVSP